ncbi:GCN5 family acetyltransferase [Burkholderia multivorans]|uniref:GNAT family N-acetyltransferase n=1 Tax=Burkholderia multivorans TaxID=87883 RepID=UPI00075473F5|nr:GNAT family N-acetyltransferase [Burkholderia multivorans]KVP24809.1 GCN5 family acetyltransferase [Burkholderia multivorans]
MRAPFAVRAARASDAGQLTTLARLSKAHWGYPREWLDLWEADLTITPETIDDSIGYVAEYEGWIVGFWIRAAMNCDRPTPGRLFVDPDHMGQGIGRALWAAVRQEAAARGIASFVIEADPHAAAFYLSLGAQRIGEKESAVIPGRFFPILRIMV